MREVPRREERQLSVSDVRDDAVVTLEYGLSAVFNYKLIFVIKIFNFHFLSPFLKIVFCAIFAIKFLNNVNVCVRVRAVVNRVEASPAVSFSCSANRF